MRLPLVARSADLNERGIVQDEEAVGPMRRMTFGALAVGNRWVRGRRPLLPGNRVGVARCTHGDHRLLQQAVVRGTVR